MLDATIVEGKSLDNFRGDFEELAKFMNDSWGENSQQSLYYTPAFLASCFEYPGAAYSLSPTIYNGAKPLGFVTAFPRIVQFAGQKLRLALITFLTVDPENKKKGYGVMLWTELVKRVRAAGFDGMVNYCIAEGDMDKIILGCCARLKLPTECVYSVNYLSRLLGRDESVSREREIEDTNMSEVFCSEAKKVAQQADIARVWSEQEAEWQCRGREGSLVSTYSQGNRGGVITGYVAPIANEKKRKCLFVEDVLWSELNEAERCKLIQDLLVRARSRGAEMATVPRCGYADLKVFNSAGFLRTRRVVRAYLSIWNGPKPHPNSNSFYMDVF